MLRLSPSCSCIRLQFDTAPISPGELFKGKGTISLTGVGIAIGNGRSRWIRAAAPLYFARVSCFVLDRGGN